MNLFQPGIRDIIDIAIVSVIVYYILKLFRGTRTIYIITGLLAVIGLSVLSTLFNLKGLIWLLSAFTRYGLLALIVIFQPEIRKGLAILGTRPFMGEKKKIGFEEIQELERAIKQMVQRGIGGIIVIEKNIKLDELIEESGVRLNSELSAPLIVSIFLTEGPLHDGALIIRGNWIVGAKTILPLSQIGLIEGTLGTRHRAALGITEHYDCLAIVVSEEKRTVRIAQKGVLSESLTFENLRKYLEELLIRR